MFVTGDLALAARGHVSRQPVLAKPFSVDAIEQAVIAVMRGTSQPTSDQPAAVPR